MFIFMLFVENIKFGKITGILTKGVQKIPVFAYTHCTHAERCYMRYSAISCPYLPLPAPTCLYLPLPAFTCPYLPLSAFTCPNLPLPALTCLIVRILGTPYGRTN